MQYTIKYHTTEAKNKSLDWIGPRLYQAKLEEVLTRRLGCPRRATCTTSATSAIRRTAASCRI